MCKFISPSKQSCFIIGMICIYNLLVGCGMRANTEKFSTKEGYLITIAQNASKEDIHWSKYLFEHLQKRSNAPEIVAYEVSEKDMWHINVQIDPAQKGFKIEREDSDLKLIASNPTQMLWLQYQLMKRISDEDKRIEGSELPPAIINMTDTCGTFAFNYQSIYSPSGLNADYSGIVGLDNFDESWGIWGHNLRKVLGSIPEQFYSTVNGKKDDSQLCFSSNEMYSRLESYIIDTFGEKGGSRFVIAPDDNPIACTCSICTALGNTSQNATPAVTQFISRLAKRFPAHSFFTTSYLSTRKAPSEKLPSNVGVIISAIDLPFTHMKVGHSTPTKQFTQQLEDWKVVTQHIYVWDYINNFDDYLTPFPILKVAQQRMQFYRNNGVNGIFLNGSGYSYSCFDEMNTFVLSSLLLNPELSVENLMRVYFKQEFPIAGDTLYNYCSKLENQLQPNKKLSLYAGIQEEENSYLNPKQFSDFYDEIGHLLNKTKDKEKKMLHKLQIALSFTRLELARLHPFAPHGYAQRKGNQVTIRPQVHEWIQRLGEYKAFPYMTSYNESGDEIGQYLNDWKQYILSPNKSENLLLGVVPSAAFTLDENYKDLTILVDGTHGLPGNYHCGWLIISENEPVLHMPVGNIQNNGTLRLSFLQMPRHRIYAPIQVELSKDGRIYKTINISSTEGNAKGQMVEAEVPIELIGSQQLSIKFIRSKGEKSQIAIDEISFIP